MWNRIVHARGVLLTALVAGACAGDDATTVTPGVKLVVSPATIIVADTGQPTTIFLTTEPSGTVNWQVAAKPEWLTLTPSRGTINRRIMEVQLSMTPDTRAEPGQVVGLLELVSDGGAARVQLQGRLTAKPLAAAAGPLVIGGAVDTTSFVLRNTGRGPLQWQSQPSASWISTTPVSGSINTGDSVRVRVTANKQPLPVGANSGSVVIKSNSTAGDLSLPLNVTVSATPLASVSATRVSLPGGVSEGTFVLTNRGKGALDWRLEAGDAWITSTPSSGQLQPNASTTVTVRVNRASLGSADAFSTVTVKSNSTGGDLVLAVAVAARAPDASGMLSLDHRVIDAEYSTSANIIVTASTSPSRLNILDPVAGTVQRVDLSRVPTSISIGLDGAYAAVGHDGAISYVNLATLRVERVYNVSCDVLDVVLGPNGWVYAFPRRDQWVSIHSVRLSSGLEIAEGWQIYAGTVARLHPSGEFMYGADNGLSPSDFEKYDIRQGAATMLYDSPYHGDYPFSGNLWISADGGRVYARSAHVFRSSPSQAEDLRYMGRLQGTSSITWAVDSEQTRKTYVLGAGNALGISEIKVYDPTTLTYLGAVPLPKFTLGNGTQVNGEGQFVFVNPTGTSVYVLQRAPAGSGLSLDWAFVTLNASIFP